MSIGAEVHMRRREKKLTILALAEKTGLSRNIISLIERGDNVNPTVQTLSILAYGLECQLDIKFKPWENFKDG